MSSLSLLGNSYQRMVRLINISLQIQRCACQKKLIVTRKKSQTNALSSFWQLRALISGISLLKPNQKLHGIRMLGEGRALCCAKATLVGFYHATGVCWGPLLIIPGTYMNARQAIKTHAAHTGQHSTGLLRLQELPCPRLCSFDRRPPTGRPAGQENKTGVRLQPMP